MTSAEKALSIDELIVQTIAGVRSAGWQDRPMTTGEEVAVNLAVRFVVKRFREEAVALPESEP
jgi:hypothetical protein